MRTDAAYPCIVSRPRIPSHLSRRQLRESEVTLRLYDPRQGEAAFRLERTAHLGAAFARPQRSNHFTVVFIEEGEGQFHADLQQVPFSAPCLLFFNPYQTLFSICEGSCAGTLLRFHANFFCIEAQHAAVGCNGVLFNQLSGQPRVGLDVDAAAEFRALLAQMEQEMSASDLAHAEALVSLLKLFLIKATRLKLEQQPQAAQPKGGHPEVLAGLSALIERSFRERHDPAFYAAALHMTPKNLGRIVKTHLGRTLTDLIRERLLKEAKWLLLHTDKPVKEIARAAGFGDEFYFSRLFKRATGFAPTEFRAYESAIRRAGNLSS
jgi:AraC-like DNA-binding protein